MADAAHEALAHAQISSLLSLYYHALDAGDFATLEREVMSEDAVWEAVQHASTGRVADSASGRDEVLRWFTGYNQRQLTTKVRNGTTLGDFIDGAPELHPHRSLITGVVCGVRVENIDEPVLREVRYMDKLVDELAKGKAMEKVLRSPADA